jgi:hypothetical protein
MEIIIGEDGKQYNKYEVGFNDETTEKYIREIDNEYDLKYIKDDGSLNLDIIAEETGKYYKEELICDPFILIKDYKKQLNTLDLGGLWGIILSGSSVTNFSEIKMEIIVLKTYNYLMSIRDEFMHNELNRIIEENKKLNKKNR